MLDVITWWGGRFCGCQTRAHMYTVVRGTRILQDDCWVDWLGARLLYVLRFQLRSFIQSNSLWWIFCCCSSRKVNLCQHETSHTCNLFKKHWFFQIGMGYSRKYPHPTYGRHWIGYLKISGFPRRTTAVFAGFQSLMIQNLEEFQNFAKIWMVFLEFRLKFTKFWRNLCMSNHTHWAFLTGFPKSSMGSEWIFSGTAQCPPCMKNCERFKLHDITLT